MTTKGRTRYCEPNMAHPPPSTTPANTMTWERRTWVDSQQLQGPRPRQHPHLQQATASPLHVHSPHVRQTLHSLHQPLPRTNRQPGGPRHLLPLPGRLHLPPYSPGPDTYSREDEQDDPHILGRWGHKSLDMLLSIRSSSQGLNTAM